MSSKSTGMMLCLISLYALSDQAHRGECTLFGQDREPKGERLLGAGAVQHRIDISSTGQVFEFITHSVGRLIACVDRLVGTVFRCDGEFFIGASECHHRRPAAEQSGVLHPVAAQTADTIDNHGAARTEFSRCPKLLRPAVGGEPRIGQRGQRFGLVIGPARRR